MDNPTQFGKATSAWDAVKRWNRKLHIHLGLFLLLFVWLFSVTGYCLNHPTWFHNQPKRREFHAQVHVPAERDNQQLAEMILRQIANVSGEIVLARNKPPPGHFTFRVLTADKLTNIDVELATGTTKLIEIQRAFAGALANLHTMTGVRRVWAEPGEPVRDWYLTRLWSLSIDATAVGMALLTLSAIILWLPLNQKRIAGLIALSLGAVSSGFFVWGLKFLAK